MEISASANFAFTEFGEEGGLGFFLERLDIGGADGFFLAENGIDDLLRAGDALDDGLGLGLGGDEGELGLGFAGEGDELLDRDDDGLDGLVREFERFDEAVFGQLVGRAFDHEHFFFPCRRR